MNGNSEDIARSLRVIKNILAVFLGITILYLLKILSNLLVPLAFALFFAILFQPVVAFFRRKFSLNVSVILTTLLTLAIFFVIGFAFYNTVTNFISNREEILSAITKELAPLLDYIASRVGTELREEDLRSFFARVIPTDRVLSLSGTFLNTISGFATELLMTILYFAGLLGVIAQYEKVIDYIMGKPGSGQHSKASETFRRVKGSISIYIKVKTIVSLITGLLIGLISWFFGIEYALLWGILAFVLNYIPYVGSFIAIIPPLLIGGISAGGISEILLLFVLLESVQIVMGSIVEPRMTGNSLSINTVTILFSLVFWAFMWNAAGMLLSVPMTFLIKVVLEQVPDAGFLVRLMDKKTGRELG